MKWRVLVLLIAGFSSIYLASLLQDAQYPHPVVIQASVPEKSRQNEPSEVFISVKDDYIYRTHLYYEAVLDANKGFVHGVDSIKAGVNGLVIQSRMKKAELLKEAPEKEWEVCFKHLLHGPITKVSKSEEDDGVLQFAVLHHTIDNQDIRHYVRIYYYFMESDGLLKTEYKEFLLPGSTMVNAISLEQDSIIYSRVPDIYRFRVASLPKDMTLTPHNEKSSPVLLKTIQSGDIAKAYQQPSGTEEHVNLLSRLYSPNSSTYRVYSLDIYKTKYMFYTNVTITDGTTVDLKSDTTTTGKWTFRDHMVAKDRIITDENLEYMAFVDGPHIHQERIVINTPRPSITRSKHAKTMVASLIRNKFQTLDFTDQLAHLMQDEHDRLYLYKAQNGEILNEFYHSMQIPEYVESSEAAYDPTDICGVQLNEYGTLLAVWTESNSIYIYKRGAADKNSSSSSSNSGSSSDSSSSSSGSNSGSNNTTSNKSWSKAIFDSISGSNSNSGKRSARKINDTGSPHHLEQPLEWILRMVITPKEGHLGSVTPIGATVFWKESGTNYISVGMKNNIVNTYLIDDTEDKKIINLHSFLRDKWDMWIAMFTIVFVFVMNEYKIYGNQP